MSAGGSTGDEGAEARLALAHALRTPLTSLSLGLGLLDGEALGPLTAEQREVVRVLLADAARLSAVVASDLRIDRLGPHAGPIERAPVDLGDLVERSARPLVAEARRRRIRLGRALEPGVSVVVDPVRMGWVIASLLGNALRYSPRGSAVVARLCRSGGQAELAIEDRGPGMPPDVRARLFDRGGGLGLFLAREIVEAHGGTIRVDSDLGQGSTFTIRLDEEGAR